MKNHYQEEYGLGNQSQISLYVNIVHLLGKGSVSNTYKYQFDGAHLARYRNWLKSTYIIGRGVARVQHTDFAVPHPPFDNFTLVAMIVPSRMCRVSHPLNSLATPLIIGYHAYIKVMEQQEL